MPRQTFKNVAKMSNLQRTKYCLAYQDACRQYEQLLTKYVERLTLAQDVIHKLTLKIMQLENRQQILHIHAQEESESESEPDNESDHEPKSEVSV